MCPSFPFGIESGIWDVIVLISGHCFSIYFGKICCIFTISLTVLSFLHISDYHHLKVSLNNGATTQYPFSYQFIIIILIIAKHL